VGKVLDIFAVCVVSVNYIYIKNYQYHRNIIIIFIPSIMTLICIIIVLCSLLTIPY
jgi:hypothetical protein